MAQHQMVCIVTPNAPAELGRDTTRLLDRALRTTGCIHFATLALLPCPAAPEGAAGPSLILELVVDDSINLRTVIEMVLSDGFQPMWQLYGQAWPGTPDAGETVRRQWLREYLVANADPAACGFIGARDRSVMQILAEAQLLADARLKFQELGSLAGNRSPEREELAQKVLRWAMSTHGGLIAEPARLSVWRRGALPAWASGALRGLRLGVPALALLAALGWLGSFVAYLGHFVDRVGVQTAALLDASPFALWFAWVPGIGMSGFGVPGLTAITLILALPVIVALIRFAEALTTMLTLGFLAGGSFILIASLLLRDGLRPAICGFQLVGVGMSAATSLAFAAATLLSLVTFPLMRAPPHFWWLATVGTALVTAAFTFLFASLATALLVALPCTTFAWQASSNLHAHWQLGWIVAGSVLVGLLLALLPDSLTALQRALMRIFKSRDLKTLKLGGPLHQVHSSIDECEARLTDRQSHMISLTEVRRPVWWYGTWLRVVLWVVNQLADVVFTDGRLGAADGIKFGHWRLIDGGRRLLFCSNYDGSFGGYLDEFIRGSSQGVNLIWRCTELRKRPPAAPGQPEVKHAIRFPPTRALILDGCKYEQAFKAYARASMLPHLHRFEAYNLSVQDIDRATRLRDALSLPRHPTKWDQILRALES